MSENKDIINTSESTDYEGDKAHYEVNDYYDTPKWYKNFVWLWPMICIWLFITIVSAPEYRLVSSISYGAAVVGFQILAWLMTSNWPISRDK